MFPVPLARSLMHFDGGVALRAALSSHHGGLWRSLPLTTATRFGIQNVYALVIRLYSISCRVYFVGTWARVRVRSKKRSMFVLARALRLMTAAYARQNIYMIVPRIKSPCLSAVCVYYTAYTLQSEYDKRAYVRACERRHVNALYNAAVCYDAHQSACPAEHTRSHARTCVQSAQKECAPHRSIPVRWHICRCRYVYYWTHGETGDADARLQAIGMHARTRTCRMFAIIGVNMDSRNSARS